MCKKIIQLGCLVVLTLLLVACENHVTYEHQGHAMHRDAQCLSLRHEIGTMNSQHHQGWTKHSIEVNKRMLWNKYHALKCS